jgi:hypothetical protein
MSFVSDLITKTVEEAKAKPAWGIALLLSIIYFFIFFLVSNNIIKETGLLFGFCVWGSPDMPSKSERCTNSPVNSHILAFGIDLFMTALAALFWVKDKNPKKSTIIYIASGFIILAHGLLHWFLQQKENSLGLPIVDCYNSDLGESVEEFGYIVFGAFSFFLSLIILSIGFEFKWTTVGGSAAFAAVVVALTKNTGGDLVLPGLFVIVHPLSCFTGLFSESPSFNTNVGRLFVVCTAVGISELSACTSFLRGIGGHLWYDVTLHAAVLASLPYFVGPKAKTD